MIDFDINYTSLCDRCGFFRCRDAETCSSVPMCSYDCPKLLDCRYCIYYGSSDCLISRYLSDFIQTVYFDD